MGRGEREEAAELTLIASPRRLPGHYRLDYVDNTRLPAAFQMETPAGEGWMLVLPGPVAGDLLLLEGTPRPGVACSSLLTFESEECAACEALPASFAALRLYGADDCPHLAFVRALHYAPRARPVQEALDYNFRRSVLRSAPGAFVAVDAMSDDPYFAMLRTHESFRYAVRNTLGGDTADEWIAAEQVIVGDTETRCRTCSSRLCGLSWFGSAYRAGTGLPSIGQQLAYSAEGLELEALLLKTPSTHSDLHYRIMLNREVPVLDFVLPYDSALPCPVCATRPCAHDREPSAKRPHWKPSKR